MYLSKSHELARMAQLVLSKRMTLQELVDGATDVLENPLLVADPGYQILAMSDMELDDSAWKNFRKLRQLPYHPDMVDDYEDFLLGVRQGKLVTVVDGRHKSGYFIRCAIMDGEQYVGQLHVFSLFHDFTDADVELAAQLASIVSIDIMRHSIAQEHIGTTSDYLVSDLIRGKLENQAMIDTRMKFVGWTLQQVKYLLLVQWDGDEKNMNFRDACVANLVRIFPDGRSTGDGPNMVIMFSTPRELNITCPELEQIRRQLEKPGLHGVLSMPFEDMMDTGYRYQQACDILELNQNLGRKESFVMAETETFDLLLQQAGQKYRLLDYCHPLIRQLMALDVEKSKERIETLRAYIISGRNFTKAAEMLHMHRNSVIYRMKQIEDLLEFDFSKDEFAFQLELSFRILDHIRAQENSGQN
jgi:hypothetical protein